MATAALGVLSPVLLIIAVLVRLTSPGPAIFRQTRVGMQGRDFTILKFRTMRCGTDGPQRSAANDSRVTRIGRILRRHKLDELPQLLHVITGKMSLVGPRPKLREHHSTEWHLRPGLTGAASVAFAAEEALLRHIPANELEAWHRDIITPHKIALDIHYAEKATFRSDLRLLAMTLLRAGRYQSLAEIPGQPGQAPEACPRPVAVTARSHSPVPFRVEACVVRPRPAESQEPVQHPRQVNREAW